MNKTFLVGDKVTYTYNDFDGSGVLEGIITEVSEDHAIAEIDGMNMYIDESNEENFTVKTTVKELKAMAKELHISNWWNLTKGVLIEKIKEAQNLSDEEKQAIADQKARENAALTAYNKDWRKYTKRFNPVEFMEKFRSGEIVLDGEEHVEEPIEQSENDEHDNVQNEKESSSMDESEAQDDAPVEQLKPKRGALIEFNGKSQNICKWGEELGISPNTLYGRIYKMNWPVEKAFTTPARKSK